MLFKKLNLNTDQVQTINSIFAIAHKTSDGKRRDSTNGIQEDIYLVFSSEIEKEKIGGIANKVILKPPLSKFGINAKLHFLMEEEFISKQCSSPSFDHNNLWLYIRGITNVFHETMPFKKWVDLSKTEQWEEYHKQNIPPIISNVRIHQPVYPTWSRRENSNCVKA